MASTYSPLKIELIGTGDQSGTWGATTNTNLGTALEEAITGSADVAFSSADVTVTLTDVNTTQTARNLRLNLTGTSGGARNLILGSGCQIEKLYLVNNGCADAITVKNTTGTGIAVAAGKSMFVFNNGTNVVDAVTYLSSLTLGTALPVASGGTGVTSSAAAPFALKGANSDITSLTGLTTALSVNQGGTGATTLAGANIPVTNVANSFTGLQTFVGTSSNADLKTSNIIETATVSATAATGTINYDITTQSVLYYTSNASANWTVNFRGSSGTSLNTIMATGESMSVTFLVTNGSTAYYNSAVQVDGSSVTPKWQGGTAPTSGNASSIDSYTYVIIKTGSAAFTVLAAQTKFA
tara:strand:- start:5656 stop:6717 length:1062 start_codon:yes stop_codon:yes gene_type:complete